MKTKGFIQNLQEILGDGNETRYSSVRTWNVCLKNMCKGHGGIDTNPRGTNVLEGMIEGSEMDDWNIVLQGRELRRKKNRFCPERRTVRSWRPP